MKIERNKISIELTAEELRLAYEEYMSICRMEDIQSIIEQNYPDVELSDEQLYLLAEKVEHALSSNDYRYEIYWECIDNVLSEELCGI